MKRNVLNKLNVWMLAVASVILLSLGSCENDTPDPNVNVSDISLDPSEATLSPGESVTLKATVMPKNAGDKTVTWTSTDGTIASVKDGIVTALSVGKVTITAKAGRKETTCEITVEPKKSDLPPIQVTIEGMINHEKLVEGQKGSVSFNRFPASFEEFKQVREKIGIEPHGAVALQIMAYEMYRRDKKIGLKCINLNSTRTNSGEKSSAVRQLNSIFRPDNSSRPYQMAAYLKGATPENGYNPEKPYTVEVIVDKGRGYGYSNDYQATVVKLMVLTAGKSSPDPVSLVKTKDPNETSEGKYFIASQSLLYSRVKPKGFEHPFNGLD